MVDVPRVICVGIAVIDLVLGVDSLPTNPGKYRASQRHEVGGGVAANASVTVASLGGDAVFIGCLGDDATGDQIVEGLKSYGVGTHAVRRVAGKVSPLSSVLVDADGERLIVNHSDPALFDSGNPVVASEIVGADVVLADMRWPSGAVPALMAARQAGIPAIVDCDHDPMVNRGDEILKAATHVIFALPTLLKFTGAVEPAEALQFCSSHTDAWVGATAGSDGVYWLANGELKHLPAFKVKAVDTLGAGDVFHGAFALAIAEGESIEAALKFASAAAALKCTKPGGRAGIPDRRQVDFFLEENESWK